MKTYLGLDYGTSSTGVAVGTELTQTANPIATLRLLKGKVNPADLEKLLKEWQPDALVMGLPLNQDGTETKVTPKVRTFAKWFAKTFHKDVYLVDERNSSTSAREFIFERYKFKGLQKSKVDQVSAAIILETFLLEGEYLEIIKAS